MKALDQDFLDEMRRRIDKARECIKAQEIVDKLQEFYADPANKPMSKLQVQVGFGLLKKVMPDLQTVEHTGSGGGPVQVIINDPTRRSTAE